eukprot:TRINITY_DN3575_c0_g1_i2.p1 TRINITY_DN3575_c0_g1~~TRINITY_DN3575_c0_g1_i2.p1  ORF type:complete len:279 (-),score=79.25 TRINITY_DN3575_c0_g1_i2:4-840(-)
MEIETGIKMIDAGDVIEYDKDNNEEQIKFPHLKNVSNVSNYCKALANKVHEECENGSFAFTVGGDHCVAVGSISGILRKYPNISVVWVDAHADINTPETTLSGIYHQNYLHGMPLSFLTNLESTKFEWMNHFLPLDNIVYIGIRDLDPGEKAILKEKKIKAYWADDVERKGIDSIMKETVDYFNKLNGYISPIHLSFDVDGLDIYETPSTGTPVRGGLTLREGKYICESLYETGRLVGMDLVEVNPHIGSEKDVETTMDASFQLLFSAFGRNCQNERA